jgi:hypothetical protein
MNSEIHVTTEKEAPEGEMLVYQAEDGKVKLDVRLVDETVWLTQQLMAELFQTSKQNISHHVQSIYEEHELSPEATVKKYLTVRREGNRDVRRELEYYNLDMIISVGYRVKSLIATRFRIWATQRLKEYLIKGFVMDDERLKNPPVRGSLIPDYFDEVRKTDVTIAKNYLKEHEILGLNRIVTMWLDFAEDQAMRRKQVFMSDWEQKLDEFLRFNDRDVLTNAGMISRQTADDHAKIEYEKFEVRRREYKESLAETDYLKQLEDAARTISSPEK